MIWEKTIVEFDRYKITIYVNSTNSRAMVFPPFGKYFSIHSDNCALDMAISFIFFVPNREVNYTQYLSSQEDTSVIVQEVA